jgi:hypothetical protein
MAWGTIEILASDLRGIYCPLHVVQSFDIVPREDCGEQAIASLSEAIEIVSEGPGGESYWDAWDEICQNGELRAVINGVHRSWRIYQDGGVFAVENSPEGDAWLEAQ